MATINTHNPSTQYYSEQCANDSTLSQSDVIIHNSNDCPDAKGITITQLQSDSIKYQAMNEEAATENKQDYNTIACDLQYNQLALSDSIMMSDTDHSYSCRRLASLITNCAHIILTLVLVQLGISMGWCRSYRENNSNFTVIFLCLVYSVCGVYGVVIELGTYRRQSKRHRVLYIFTGVLNGVATVFIIFATLSEMLKVDYKYQPKPVLIIDSLIIALSGVDIIITVLSIHYTFYAMDLTQPYNTQSETTADEFNATEMPRPLRLSSVLMIMLNTAQILLGISICELVIVGIIYNKRMNIRNSGLLSAGFISFIFIVIGAYGIYLQAKDKLSSNYTWYSASCLLSAACATIDLIIAVMTVTSKYYYSGIEVIVTFDYMILSLSGAEIIVSIVCILFVGYFHVLRKPLASDAFQGE